MLIRFDNQVALVTGAAQGIGRAIAQGLSDAGARVHIADIDADGVRAAADVMEATPHVCDLSDRAQARAMIDAIVAKEHRLDILALAAGGVRGQVGRPLEDITPADWHDIFRANVDGAFYLAQAAAPVMKKHKRGRIITVSSGAGLRPSLTGIQAYSAAKHALIGLTKQLAQELGPFGVTVNSVAPGFVLSNPNSKRQFESYGAEGQKKLVESFYLKRLGSAEDIAHAVIFFASEQANWISGQVLSVDGGRA